MKSSVMLLSLLTMRRITSSASFIVAPTIHRITKTFLIGEGNHVINKKKKNRYFSKMAPPLKNSNLPTIEELSTDPFMKQVEHASTLVPLLNTKSKAQDDNVDMYAMLKAQLSHSDGIRGFFVSYLTGNAEEEEEEKEMVVPKSLKRAMKDVDPKELVPLACMNVIMPTAMITMHTDPTLSASSKQTAQRGKVILKTLLSDEADGEVDEFLVLDNCLAMLEAVTGMSGDDNVKIEEEEKEEDNDDEELDEELVKYWQEFYEKWGYKEQQLTDIYTAVSDILA